MFNIGVPSVLNTFNSGVLFANCMLIRKNMHATQKQDRSASFQELLSILGSDADVAE